MFIDRKKNYRIDFLIFIAKYSYSGNKLLPLGKADNIVFCGMSNTMATCRADMIRRCSSIKDLGFCYAAIVILMPFLDSNILNGVDTGKTSQLLASMLENPDDMRRSILFVRI